MEQGYLECLVVALMYTKGGLWNALFFYSNLVVPGQQIQLQIQKRTDRAALCRTSRSHPINGEQL